MEAQTELKSVIAFWKKELGISGILVTNSTNLLSDMASALNSILSSGLDDANTFAWFADDPSADKLLTDKRLCYVELINNERITTRTEDIEAQLHPIVRGFCALLSSEVGASRHICMQPVEQFGAPEACSSKCIAPSPMYWNSYQEATATPYDATKFFIGAVAAAAAAGYSRVANPLSLTTMMGSSSTEAAAYASRYQAACHVAYQNQCCGYQQQQYADCANLQRHASAFQAPVAYNCSQYSQCPSTSEMAKPATSTPRTPGAGHGGSGRRSRKREASETSAKSVSSEARRREDFDRLVRARTEKLMHDGPLLGPLSVKETGGNASSTSSCGSLANSTDGACINSRLLRAVVDEKIRALMSSPLVRATLRSRQAAVGAQKRSSELFAVQLHSTRN